MSNEISEWQIGLAIVVGLISAAGILAAIYLIKTSKPGR